MISLEREKLLSELEQKIGYSFRSRATLDRALTHRSFANERVAEKCQHNEAMEFLGDSVLGFVVSAWLLERFPNISEGKLSKIKSYLVSEASLVELAEILDLGRYILLNRGEEKTGGRRKRALLADSYEALLGAMYIDGGVIVAERFLRREMRFKLKSIDPSSMIGADFKSALQERLQAAGGPGPEYAVVEVLGPDHRRTFRVELRVAGRALAMGEGHTIKIAQQEAAREVLKSPETLDRIQAELRQEAYDEIQDCDLVEDDETIDEIELTARPDDETPLLEEMPVPEEDFEQSLDVQAVEVGDFRQTSLSSLNPDVDDPVFGGVDKPACSSEAETEEEAHTVASDTGD